MTDYRQLYDQHADFRRFVDKAMHDHGYTLEQALEIKTLQDVGDYYMKGGAHDGSDTARRAKEERP